MVYAAAWLSARFDLEVLSFGHASDAPEHSCKLEMVGRHLLNDVRLDAGGVFIAAAVADRADPPEFLLRVPDAPYGWQTVCKLISAFDRNAIRALTPRPLRVGSGSGPDVFVIG